MYILYLWYVNEGKCIVSQITHKKLGCILRDWSGGDRWGPGGVAGAGGGRWGLVGAGAARERNTKCVLSGTTYLMVPRTFPL